MKNEISLDVSASPELRDIFAGKKVGETCELTVKFQVNEINDASVKGTIEAVTPHHGYSEDDEGEEKETTPDMEHPVAIVMEVGPSKGSKKREKEMAGASSY